MDTATEQERRRLERLDRGALEAYQIERLNRFLERVLPANQFYAEKLASVSRPVAAIADLIDWPFTFKEELLSTSHDLEMAANLTYPREHYSRFHQTSGTRGRPLVVLDTAEDWPWWLGCWQYVLDAADIHAGDCVFLAFSFGPFIGFWSAYDGALARGCLVVPGGGMSTRARLDMIRRSSATAVFCTPSYALRMDEVGEEHSIDVSELGVKTLVLAGEPGGSTTNVRARIEQAWQAKLIDHAGASEVGPWGYGDPSGTGIYVNEAEFIAEFLSIETGEAARELELSELVLTSLGRTGCPVFRYRTGDLVRPTWQSSGDRRFVFLEGGVLGRADDMLVVRGVNVFPSSIDEIIRSFPEVVEYRVTVRTQAAMGEIVIDVEDRLSKPERIAHELQLRLGLKVEVREVPLASLPRFEGKGKRFVDERQVTKE